MNKLNNQLSIFILVCFSLYLCEAKKTIPGIGNVRDYYLRSNGITEKPKNYEPDLIPEESDDRGTYEPAKKVNQYKPIKKVKHTWWSSARYVNPGYGCRKLWDNLCVSDGECCSMYCWKADPYWKTGVCKMNPNGGDWNNFY